MNFGHFCPSPPSPLPFFKISGFLPHPIFSFIWAVLSKLEFFQIFGQCPLSLVSSSVSCLLARSSSSLSLSQGFLGVQVFRGSGVQGFRCSGVQVFRCSGVQVFRWCSGVQVFRCSVFGCFGDQVFRVFRVFRVCLGVLVDVS